MPLWRKVINGVGEYAGTVRAGYYKAGGATLIEHINDGMAQTCILEVEEMIKEVGTIELEGKLRIWKSVYSAEGDAPCVTAALGGGGKLN